MNKKILTIFVFNFLIFSFQLNAMKEYSTSPKYVPGGRRPSSPGTFEIGTPPAQSGSKAHANYRFNSGIQNELPVFKSKELNEFIKENNLNSHSIFSEDWREIVCDCDCEDLRCFVPDPEILFLVAYVFCHGEIGVEDAVSILRGNLNNFFWSWVRGMFVRYKESCEKKTHKEVVYKNCVKTLSETVFPKAMLIAVQEEDLAVQEFLKKKIEKYNRILNSEDRED